MDGEDEMREARAQGDISGIEMLRSTEPIG